MVKHRSQDNRHRITVEIFLRMMGLVYFFAFASYGVQVTGLVGNNGIAPMSHLINTIATRYPLSGMSMIPSVFWLSTSDNFLQIVSVAGAVTGLVVACGYECSLLLAVLWILYLSVLTTGSVFMGFQWDALLLESGFLAIFTASFLPLSAAARISFVPSISMLWLNRFLAFRLMFMSGCVKILSGDHTWRDLTAMAYHYETQPLPNPLAWYLHQLPMWWHKIETGAVLFIELIVPLLIFAPRPLRLSASIVLILLQVLIMASGNYAFFNWLTIAICITLLDDRFLQSLLPRSFRHARAITSSRASAPRKRILIRNGIRSIILTIPAFALLGSLALVEFLALRPVLPESCIEIIRLEAPLHLVNSYGLFAVMTTSRPEIIVEGSDDGKIWKEYRFKYKPGDLVKAPPIVAPHQPRLDWQMWFAALGSVSENDWLLAFAVRLLQGSKSVLGLLETNPFPDKPPLYIRATTFDYHFTTIPERNSSGNWWKRTNPREYLPPTSLDDVI